MKRRLSLFIFISILFVSGCVWVPYDGPVVQNYPYGVPSDRYYANPPINPGIPWQYWYLTPTYPGFVFFFGSDGKHYRHDLRGYRHQRRDDGFRKHR